MTTKPLPTPLLSSVTHPNDEDNNDDTFEMIPPIVSDPTAIAIIAKTTSPPTNTVPYIYSGDGDDNGREEALSRDRRVTLAPTKIEAVTGLVPPSNPEINGPPIHTSASSTTNSVPNRGTKRRNMMVPTSSQEKPMWASIMATIMIAVGLVGVCSLFIGSDQQPTTALSLEDSSSDLISKLRSEFRSDLESFRSDIGRELDIHLLASAAVKKAAMKSVNNNGDTIDARLESTTTATATATVIELRDNGGLLHEMDMAKPVMIGKESTVSDSTARDREDGRYVATHRSKDYSPKGQLPPTVVASLDSNPKTLLQHAADYINLNYLEFWAWLAVLLLLLYNYCGTSRDRDGYDDNDRVNSHDDDKGKEKRRGGSKRHTEVYDDNRDAKKRKEEDVMENLFNQAVVNSTSVRRTIVPVIPRVHTGGNNNSIRRDVGDTTIATATATQSSSSSSKPSISNKERMRLARANAKEFAARDKHRLNGFNGSNNSNSNISNNRDTNAAIPSSSSSTKPLVSKKERLSQVRGNNNISSSSRGIRPHTNTTNTQSPPSSPASKPSISKKERLKQARANAESFAKRDKQTLMEASGSRGSSTSTSTSTSSNRRDNTSPLASSSASMPSISKKERL